MGLRGALAAVGSFLVLALVPAASAQLPLRENWDALPAVSYVDGHRISAHWVDAWNGGGAVEIGAAPGRGRVLQLAPGFTGDADTHSALVLSTRAFGHSDSAAAMRTVRQVKNAPNPWEVGWLVIDYHRDACRNNVFYYLLLKQGHGWELGKTYSDGSCAFKQHFLATGDGNFRLGEWYTPRITVMGNRFTAYDGKRRLGVAVDDGAFGGVYRSGQVGFYTEDAVVQFDEVTVH
jgi:hypothetical protein